MKPGPKPKPRGLRLLEGNRGHATIPDEPDAAKSAGYTQPPYEMDDDARAVWDRLAPELDSKALLAPRYADGFAAYCVAVVACQRSARILAREGPIIIGTEGGPISNPASREFRHHAQLMRAYASEYGLTPASITALARTRAETEAARDPARLLG
jgi:P27 family predicted phage terminase small subunit